MNEDHPPNDDDQRYREAVADEQEQADRIWARMLREHASLATLTIVPPAPCEAPIALTPAGAYHRGMPTKSKLGSINRAEQLGGTVAALVTIACVLGVPSRLNLTADDVGALIGGLMTLAAAGRAAWQAWRAGDIQGAADQIEAAAGNPKIVDAIELAVARASDRIEAKRTADAMDAMEAMKAVTTTDEILK